MGSRSNFIHCARFATKMGYNIFHLLVALVFVSELVTAKESCQGDWYDVPTYGCFLFVTNEAMSWIDAQTYCENHGGYLAEIYDSELQEGLSLFSRIIASGQWYGWIGGNDIGSEGDWFWIHSRNSVEVSFWDSGY